MGRFRFAIAVAITSLAVVATIGLFAVLATPIGALVVPSAQASGQGIGAPWIGPHGFGGPGFDLPPELQGLVDLPPAERFSHFLGVQVNLKDKDNKPFTANVIPGTATAVSANSLTIAGNDGAARTFALNDATVYPCKGSQANQPGLANGDQVVVVTFNDDTTARVVVNCGTDGSGPWGFGPPPWVHSGWFHR